MKGLSRTSLHQSYPPCMYVERHFHVKSDTLTKIVTLSQTLLTHAKPVSSKSAEGRRPVAAVVHVSHRIRDAGLGQHLLVLDSRAFIRLPHVYVLQRDCKTARNRFITENDMLNKQTGENVGELTLLHTGVQLRDLDGQAVDTVLKRVCAHIKSVGLIKKLPKNIFCMFTYNQS